MKERVKVEVPLIPSMSRYQIPTVIKIPPPCFYCGADVDEIQEHLWVKEGKYEVQAWAPGKKFGMPVLSNVFIEGEQIIGKYRIEIPFCKEHIYEPKVFKIINLVSLGLGFLLGISYFISHLIGFGFEWEALYVLIVPIISTALFYVIGGLIQGFVTKVEPKYKDYSLMGRYGISIHGVTFLSHPTISYSIRIGFSDPAAALRFLKYNRARVVKGEKLLDNEINSP